MVYMVCGTTGIDSEEDLSRLTEIYNQIPGVNCPIYLMNDAELAHYTVCLLYTSLLDRNPKINVIATFNEWTSLGVGWAIRDIEARDRIWVTAFDSNAVSVGMLETGEVDSLIVQNPYAMGYLGVEAAVYLVNETGKPQESIGTDTILVNRDNMFEEECQKLLFPFSQ